MHASTRTAMGLITSWKETRNIQVQLHINNIVSNKELVLV